VVIFWRPVKETNEGLEVTVTDEVVVIFSKPEKSTNFGFLSIIIEELIESNAVAPTKEVNSGHAEI
jgi:hypothetical protein